MFLIFICLVPIRLELNWMLSDEFIDMFENSIPFEIKENAISISTFTIQSKLTQFQYNFIKISVVLSNKV